MKKKDHPRIIRSDALDALHAKEADARQRLSRHLIAFVRSPRRTGIKGWLFSASDSPVATYQAPTFMAFVVANPRTQASESCQLIQQFWQFTADSLDEEDAHASVILAEVREYQRYLLEDKDEARANAAEFLFIDAGGDLAWCDYGGACAGQGMMSGGQAVLIRGCYDPVVHQAVRQALGCLRRRARPTSASLKAAVRSIRQATRLSHVGYVPIA